MKTKIEFPKVTKLPRWHSTPELENQREESIKARREFWNSLFTDWGYKEVVFPTELYQSNFTLDGVTIYFVDWIASEGRCYVRQEYGNSGIWSFFEIDKPVNIEKVKDTVRRIWEAKSAKNASRKLSEDIIAHNESILPKGFGEKFSKYAHSVVVEATCFRVTLDYTFEFKFDLSGKLAGFSMLRAFGSPSGDSPTTAFAKLRKEIEEKEAKAAAIEKELVDWFSGIKNS